MSVIQRTKKTYPLLKDYNEVISLFYLMSTLNLSAATKIAVHYGLFCKSI